MTKPDRAAIAAGLTAPLDIIGALDHLTATRCFVEAGIMAAGTLADPKERDALRGLGAHVRDRLAELSAMLQLAAYEVLS